MPVDEHLSKMELSRSVVNNGDTTALSMELDAVCCESRESLLLANDNKQFSCRNNLRLCTLKSVNGEDCQLTAANFIRTNLHVTVNEADIEMAHMTAGSLQCTAAQQRRPIMLM